jgi:hypothetical protein
MLGAIPLLPQYVFMAYCLVKHRDYITFTFYIHKGKVAPVSRQQAMKVNRKHGVKSSYTTDLGIGVLSGQLHIPAVLLSASHSGRFTLTKRASDIHWVCTRDGLDVLAKTEIPGLVGNRAQVTCEQGTKGKGEVVR